MEKTEPTEQQTPKELKREIYRALLEEPTLYHVLVVNNSSLPENLKPRKEITFEIKPPVISTLTKVAAIANTMDGDVFNPTKDPENLVQYSDKMCEMLAILAHGNSQKDMPDWYVPFLKENLTPKEVLMMFQETAMKLRTDFFLPSFQIAKVNPLLMESVKVTRWKRSKRD